MTRNLSFVEFSVSNKNGICIEHFFLQKNHRFFFYEFIHQRYNLYIFSIIDMMKIKNINIIPFKYVKILIKLKFRLKIILE